MSLGPTGTRRAVLTAVTGACLLTVMLWAASSPVDLVTSPDYQAPTPAPPPEETAPPRPTLAELSQEGDGPTELSLDWLSTVAGVLLAIALLLFFRWLLKQIRPLEREPDDDLEGLDEWEALREATSQERQDSYLYARDPRNAIVECWAALEDAASRSGLVRQSSETSVEFTHRVLSRWQVDQSTISELRELYREARFSRHEVTDDQRRTAVRLLGELNQALQHSSERESEQ